MTIQSVRATAPQIVADGGWSANSMGPARGLAKITVLAESKATVANHSELPEPSNRILCRMPGPYFSTDF